MTPDQILHLILAVSVALAVISMLAIAYHLGQARAERRCARRLAEIERSYQSRFLAAVSAAPLVRIHETRL